MFLRFELSDYVLIAPEPGEELMAETRELAVQSGRSNNPAALESELRDVTNVLINPAFRADWGRIAFALGLLVAMQMLAYSYPSTLVRIPLMTFGEGNIGIVLPTLIIFPAIVMAFVVHRRFDTQYIVSTDRLIKASGLCSFNRHTKDLYFSNVSGIEIDQSVLGRIFGFGTLRVGPLIRDAGDIYLEGIRYPEQYKSLLERRLMTYAPSAEIEDQEM